MWRNTEGSILLEFTIVFPLLMMVLLGTIDVSFMLFDWALADNATYVGAHRAIVSSPVASALSTPTWKNLNLGDPCYDGSTLLCDNVNITCTSSGSGGTCTGSGGSTYSFDSGAFTTILDAMQGAYGCSVGATSCPIQASNVVVNYSTSELGFVGQPTGTPVTVTVSLRCMVHELYFLNALMQWVFPPICGKPARGWPTPAYATTLSGEDMVTN